VCDSKSKSGGEEEGERGQGDIVAAQTERKAERRETAIERSTERLFVRKCIPSGYRSNRFRAFFFAASGSSFVFRNRFVPFIFPPSLSLSLSLSPVTYKNKAGKGDGARRDGREGTLGFAMTP